MSEWLNACTTSCDLAWYAEEVYLLITYMIMVVLPIVKTPQQATLFSQALTAAWFTT